MMIINEQLDKLNMSKYRLCKESGVPQATINDICSGKTDLNKCSSGTLYKLAKTLGLTMEEILESNQEDYRCSFEIFKSNICHQVKNLGDEKFLIEVLESDRVRDLYNKKWYQEALYLLGMVDYLSRENNIPICSNYNDIRSQKLEKPIYPSGVIVSSEVLQSDEPFKIAEQNAIPEFRRFNIIENEVRNIV